MQQALLLPVTYFMVTFDLPEELREVAYRNQRTIYGLFFRTSAAALRKLARDRNYVGGQLGFFGVLQTWTRDLRYHPQIHYIVAGGRLSAGESEWKSAREDFLVPVKALSKIFRAKFRDALPRSASFKRDERGAEKKTDLFKTVPPAVWKKDWVVHCEPTGSGHMALKYLAPYIFRVAISNKRILKLEDGQVTFQYKESATGRFKTQTLSAERFIHRFLQHVLPRRFIKVRYYGFLSSRKRPQLERVKELLQVKPQEKESAVTTCEAATDAPPARVIRCPKCGSVMRLVGDLPRHARHPP